MSIVTVLHAIFNSDLIFFRFSVLDDFFYGFAVSNRPQCPPLQSIHNNNLAFEVRGVHIENIENRMVSQNSVNETINFNLSCAVAL